MFRKIIWATDGSECADQALPYAKTLAAGGSLLVLRCEELLFGRVGVYPPFTDNERLDEKIRQQVSNARSEGVKTTFELVTGDSRQAADVIADVARETGADLVVVGSHGYSAVAGLLLGSVTQQLLHVAPCPILAIPPMKQMVANEAFEPELVGAVQ